VAHNLFHLLAEGKAVIFTVGGLFGTTAEGSSAIAGTGTIQVLQYSLLAAGVALSVFTARRIAMNRHGDTPRDSALDGVGGVIGMPWTWPLVVLGVLGPIRSVTCRTLSGHSPS
jgi:hypothetical protein